MQMAFPGKKIFDHIITSFFTDSSLQASQQGTKTQGATKAEEQRRIEAKESDTSTTRPRYETSFDEWLHASYS